MFALAVANFGTVGTVLADVAVLQEDSHAGGDAHSGSALPHEKAEENETEAFKHSASVQLVARMTGLSLENAYWLCVLLNFTVVAGLIIWAWKKTMPEVFRNRTASIQKAMEEARKASEDASRRLGEVEARLARLDGEISEMRGAAEMEMLAEEERIKAAAREEVKKVVEAAEQEIEAAAKSARRELKAFAADLVVSLAEKQITVDAPTDQALVREFSGRLASQGDGRRGGR
jgi:F-type H+-transporting ATPase subunit b